MNGIKALSMSWYRPENSGVSKLLATSMFSVETDEDGSSDNGLGCDEYKQDSVAGRVEKKSSRKL